MKVPHIAFFLASLGKGGIGRVVANLSCELVQKGIRVDLVLGNTEGPYFSKIDPKVKVFNLGSSHAVFCVPSLMAYLRRERPQVMITERVRVNVAAVRARRLSRVATKIFAGVHTTMSLEMEHLRPAKQRSQLAAMRRYYPKNDGFIAVSQGVREDLLDFFQIAPEKVKVAYNPVVTPLLLQQAGMPVTHPFFSEPDIPVILGVGRLEPQKDFPTLIEAFGRLRQKRRCRLIILGQGSGRSTLEALSRDLEVEEDVDFPGFVENPYAYMAKAQLFVLCSAWEGFGNVLVEAMASGTPVVATDCPSGPREILAAGKYGPLVPVGDAEALSEAMDRTLANPLEPALLREVAQSYTTNVCTDNYLKALGL